MIQEINKKHAFLIMAHHRPDVLKELLKALDDPRNDIFLHIDKKSGDDMDADNFHTLKSKLFFIPRMSVNWGGYSQVECTLNLLEYATLRGSYMYYHLMTGATFPIKSNDHMHDFFDAHYGREFMEFSEKDHKDRVQYFWPFNEFGKKAETNIFLKGVRGLFIRGQRLLNINRFKKFGLVLKKGLAYWSVTEDFAKYVIEKRPLIKKMMKYSVCGDEIFMQTLVYNSSFKENIYGYDKKSGSSMRLSTWTLEDTGSERKEHNFIFEDLDYILKSGALFAFKFDGPDGVKLIQKIKETL